ncbi:hypothetical protein PHYPO_G00039990 [Pangasianodon hypophthalmus]|uniref:Uncharacterized protein n=1 Tax=Pangasianodon hypophthalmus TaxID=310915 RepID=A0A5N5MH83_PANHP|nr:hypothetical protein PHYPO_G00039990 [Pangasianodon hypophthalmus]
MGPIELLHMSVFSQSFSPCGRFLAAGNNYGEIAVFSLSAALSPDATDASQKPILTFTAHEGPVFSLLSTDTHLLSSLLELNTKAVWTKRPDYKTSLEIPEINTMIINTRDNSLVVGGGDNNIHIMDMETGTFKSVLQGHTDYIHCLSLREREGEILSGAEDGAVRMWDWRTGRSVHCVEVYKYELCGWRPSLCGISAPCLPPPSSAELSSEEPVPSGTWSHDQMLILCNVRHFGSRYQFKYDVVNRIFSAANTYVDKLSRIFAVGEGPYVSHCLLGGSVKAQIPCTPPSLNTLALNLGTTEHRLCGGGPALSLWHLRSMSPTSIFSLSGCQREAVFHQDLIFAVGEGPYVSHCLLGGSVKAQIPCTPPSLNTHTHRVMTVAGSSNQIDVFTNFSYRAFSLSF